MTDDRRPAALTGATGDLSPDELDEAFVPAERRLMEQDTPRDTSDASEEPSLPGATPSEQPGATDVQVDPQDDRY
ncbi:MAG: hypothetical protein ABI622_00225 [Chloroflexota bacterium]